MAVVGWFLARPGRLITLGGIMCIAVLATRMQLLERARDRAEARARASRLEYVNLLAIGDTTRLRFADSLRGVTRLVEQLRVESHVRLAARNREAAARADLELRLDSIRAIVHAPSTEDSAGVRHTVITLDSVPLHLQVTLEIPPPPQPARAAIAAQLDPASLTLELACVGDVAHADAVGPTWLRLQLVRVQQSPAVCIPARPVPMSRRPSPIGAVLRGGAIGASVGAVVRSGERLDGALVGAAVGAGIELLWRAITSQE